MSRARARFRRAFGRCVTVACAVLSMAAAHPGDAAGQSFPAGPVKIVVPYPISGPTDIRGTSRMTKTYRLIAVNSAPPISDTLARISAAAIGAETRHPVVLERQPGAGTTRGATAVARARADGHTLLLASNVTMVVHRYYFPDTEYRPERDFVTVAPLAIMPFVLMVGAGVPAERLGGLIEWLKLRPGEINYGSSGEGSMGHLAGTLFQQVTGVSMVHVPYNGGLAALSGIAQNQISVAFLALPLAMHYLSSEYFRPLGIASARRFEHLPALPTLEESGLPGFEVEAWFAVFGPARMPGYAVSWLNGRITADIRSDATRAQLFRLGLVPAADSLAEPSTRLRAEGERWGPVLRASRISSSRGGA